jgi:hypothetical protein
VWASMVKKMPATATAFLVLLVLAALLAPIEQARVHQLTSLDENMGFGLPFAALAAGYALGAWRQWLGWQRHWGKVIATTAAVITVIMMLIVGRVERVQFRGPGRVAANTIASAIARYHKPNTYVLVDGSPRTDQYNVRSVASSWWLSSRDPEIETIMHICHRNVSVVVLRTTGPSDRSLVGPQLTNLVNTMFTRKAYTGSGDHMTEVFALNPGAQACAS